MEDLTNNNTKKIRVLYPDPDATDTSSDEIESTQKKSKRKVHEVVVDDHEVKFPNKVAKLGPVSDQQSPGKYLVGSKDSNKLTGEPRYAGVKRTKWGKFGAVIRDPFKKKRIWLGSFATAEAASKAYISKKREFEEKLSAERGFDWVLCAEDPSPTHDSPSSVLANETFESSDETRRCGGGAAEEEVSGENEASEELGFINGVQIVDKYGFLLGEFRWIDDLRIRIDENGCFC